MLRVLPILALLAAVSLLAAPPAAKRSVIHVPVWIESRDAAVPSAQFTARVNGAPARIASTLGPQGDLVLLVVFDLTSDLSLADAARDALTEALASLPANTRVALLRAQDGLHVLSDPSADRAAIAAAIRAIPVSGKAGLLDTVELAARIADSMLTKTAVRAGVLYLTDSDVSNYREDFINPVVNSSDQHDMSRRFPEGLVREKTSQLERKLSVFESPLFLVHLSYRADRLNEAYQAGIARLAASSGGSSAFCRSRTEIPGAVASAVRAIASHYSLALPLPQRHPRAVQVELESEGRTLIYRDRFTLEER